MARLSVCIVNWNTCEDLQACLNALQTYPFTGGEQEIIVVDNASGDGSAQMVREAFSGVRLIANDRNESFAKGTNQALDAAMGDLLLLLNPDAEVTEGALDALAAFLASKPYAAAVAPRLVYKDGRTQASVRGFPEPPALLADIFKLAKFFPKSRTLAAYRMPYFDYDAEGEAPQPMASCFLLTRKAYETVGAMDERFPLYWNDVDWCLRAYQANFKIYYTPSATVEHGYGGTTKKARVATVWESHRALLRLYAKHYRSKTSLLLYDLLTVIITVGAWMRTGKWGESLGKNGGETTPESLHRELERAGRSSGVSEQP